MKQEEIIWLETKDLTTADTLAAMARDYFKLSKEYTAKDLQVNELYNSSYFVMTPKGLDYSSQASHILMAHNIHPREASFRDVLQENYNREEDGRKVVKELITMLDSGLGGVPQSQIAVLFKEMGWVRSMLKEGFFETAYWELTQVFIPKGLLTAEQNEGIRLKCLELAQKYNTSFDGTVS